MTTRAAAISEIAKKVFPKEVPRAAENKIHSRMRRAKIQPGKYADEEFCRWVVDVWPQLAMEDWLKLPPAKLKMDFLKEIKIGDKVSNLLVPGDSERQLAIVKRAAALEEENFELREQLFALKSDQEKRISQNRLNGRKGGLRNKK